MKKLNKRAVFAIIICSILSIHVYKKWPDSSIKVIFCDVGQGDSVLIQQGFFQMLIDSGKDDRVLSCLGKFLPEWDRTLEMLILTHADEDHIGFMAEILDLYQAKFVFFPGTDKDNATTRALKEAISKEQAMGAQVKKPILGQSIALPSGGTITFLERPGQNEAELTDNERSIVFLLEYGGTKWLFTGDLEANGEAILVKDGLLPEVNVLKVGHHGSNTSSSPDFLEGTRPGLSVISVGAGNSYGHPTAEVLSALQKIGSVILRTDQLGSIELTTDGSEIWVQAVTKNE